MDNTAHPIRLSKADIAKFRSLWLEKFGVKIDKKEAQAKLLLLVRQVEIVNQKDSNYQGKELFNE